jgi:L-ascorbate metabolism protein UlaG (beta-lactamase superfamily)
MDHWDKPSLRALESAKTTVVAASKTTDLLRAKRYGAVHELSWNEEVRIGDIEIRAFEVKHWGARMQRDTYRGYNGYVIESPNFRVLFGGDTAMTDTFSSVRTSRGIDLGIVPIGAYNPWINAHCTPEQALEMANQAGVNRILPVHHKTFQLSNEPTTEPIERLIDALGSAQDRLVLREIGEEANY